MNKVAINVEGMMCGMCEAHINDTIRKVYLPRKNKGICNTQGARLLLGENPFVTYKAKLGIIAYRRYPRCAFCQTDVGSNDELKRR